MLQVRKINYHDNSFVVLQEFTEDQAGACLEYAEAVHAATMGLSEDENMNKEFAGPYAVHITDEHGESKWAECSRTRCPQVGMLQ